MLPLEGLRVVALEQAVAGPFCSRQLADLGADVIKVERPGEGDLARGYDGALGGVSAYFAWLNRGKRSVVLDVKSPDGAAALENLLAGADVFVHNLLPGAVERLGFGWDTVRERFPRLIWVSISGYGLSGSYAHKKAYDMLIQAEAGVIALTGSAEAAAKVGISVADIASGLYAHSSILAALLARGRTGQGERIEISMFEALTEWMMPPMYSLIGQGRAPGRAGLRHNMIVPYGAYRCADGQVMFAVQNEREWMNFCTDVLGRPDLTNDEQFATNAQRLAHRAPLEDTIEAAFAALSREEVSARLERAGIASARVNSVQEVVDHPQLQDRQRWTQVQTPAGTIPALLPPHNLGSAPPRMGRVPALGEHTAEVLAELQGAP
ncbi:CoA transferase [Deinococcus sp. Arct2-2]|uniref:CaiB/BaiF CoA transferase family protein n=1 Tax=Deinococcus sp. Arct2-2 TaxID=2568653 RepID=UPI0010A2EFDA|nr:CaiB/BaiF CoA-transferase family protein [Deinococcus sp. Arct2-2]THF69894.1 CoA transferase [Deinococcus sp. Arct2-2]THF69922.1 CoA transferase [Deinococcus sp. Arct2-2]